MEAIIHFDVETGKLLSVGNTVLSDEFPYITVNFSEVEKIVSGIETVDQYKISYDSNTKEYVLETCYESAIKILTWDDNLYKVPVQQSLTDADITLIRDTTKKIWKLKIHPSRREIFKVIKSSAERTKLYTEFYITHFNDANVLVQTLRFDVTQITKNGEIVTKELDCPPLISVYCRKIFTNYNFVQI